jgi:hypothetical protein
LEKISRSKEIVTLSFPAIIMFNGPPRSGKDTATAATLNALAEHGFTPLDVEAIKMSQPLKSAVHTLFGIHSQYNAQQIEDLKDQKLQAFREQIPREVYISLSEDWAKPRFGEDFFGWLAVRRMRRAYETHETQIFVISDIGFSSETFPIVDTFVKDSCLLVQLSRPDTTFEKDSRSYVEIPGLVTVEIANNGTIAEFRERVRATIAMWLEGKGHPNVNRPHEADRL